MGKKVKVNTQIDDIILEVLGDEIKREDIKPEVSLTEDYGVNSLKMLEIALTISADFDIDVPKEEVADLSTIQDIYDFVQNHS